MQAILDILTTNGGAISATLAGFVGVILAIPPKIRDPLFAMLGYVPKTPGPAPVPTPDPLVPVDPAVPVKPGRKALQMLFELYLAYKDAKKDKSAESIMAAIKLEGDSESPPTPPAA